MNISEMTLEQLQDLALKQQEQINGLQNKEAQLTGKITELTELNTILQKRNNDLFMRVEQGVQPTPEAPKQEEAAAESCEDFAKNLVLNNKL